MIGLLNAYCFEKEAPAYQLAYGPMFLDFLHKAMPQQRIRSYGVGLGELPESPDECDGWIITGSPKSAYDPDPWILKLGGFVQKIHRAERPLVGVCFGHQLIAHYLGGKTAQAKQGWGLGVRSFEVFSFKSWMQPSLKRCALMFSHQDQVVKLPPGAVLLAQDEFCPHQMFTVDDHVFCLQGHPEFTPSFLKDRLQSRSQLFGEEVCQRAIASLSESTNAWEVGQWLRLFFEMQRS